MPMPVPSASAIAILDATIAGEVQAGRGDRLLHAQDASVFAEIPQLVVRPRSATDLVTIVRWAGDQGLAITPRAAATSLAGQATGGGLVVDISRHLTAIGAFDAAARRVRVDPGVILDDLNDHLAPSGLFFGPDTSTSNRCMIGGMIGNNACGSFSVTYGSTRENLHSVDCVLADGSAVTFGPLTEQELAAKLQQTDLEGAIYVELDTILRQHAELIRSRSPKPEIHRRNTGYALDALLAQAPWTPGGPPCNLAALLCGSEGTLALSVSAELMLVPRPRHRALCCVHFASVVDACRASVLAVEHRCHAAELIDDAILQATKDNLEMSRRRHWVQGDPGAVLVIELEDGDEAALDTRMELLVAALRERSLGHSHPVIRGGAMNDVWAVRKAGLGLLMGIVANRKALAMIEDTAVAAADLPAYVTDIGIIMQRHEVSCVHYGHAAAGELHLRPNLDLRDPADAARFRSIAQEVAELVASYGGSLSGEHGDGRLRAPFIETVLGSDMVALFRRVKQVFDPSGIFNPGKIVDPAPLEADWRTAPGTPDHHVATAFDWSASLGLVRATEQCNGAGACRKSSGRGTMCPSYHVTKEERHSTRGRANLFRQLLTASDPTAAFTDHELADALELCLGCKACAAECPANVDMARLKAEFLHQRHRRLGTPAKDARFGRFTRSARLAALAPGLASRVANSRLAKRLLGVDPRRSMPTFAGRRFSTWWPSHCPHGDGARGTVCLFVDEFTEYLEPQIARDAVYVLERCGYQVEPVIGDSARALISRGLLDEARNTLASSLEQLRSAVERGLPILGIEPSAILGFVDEAPDLVGPAQADLARRVATQAQLVDDFLATAFAASVDPGWRQRPLRAVLHGHCHQKALAGTAGSLGMLRAVPGAQVRELNTGCCGMAGSFGYQHYDLSMAIGEDRLFPAVRARETDEVVCAPGTSCRHQIHDGTGVEALHPVSVLRRALH